MTTDVGGRDAPGALERAVPGHQGPHAEHAPGRSPSGVIARRPAPDHDVAASRLAARTGVCAALTAPVLVLAWLPLLRFPHWQWVVVLLAVPVVTWGAWPLHRAAVARAREGALTLESLTSLTVLIAVVASGLGFLAGRWTTPAAAGGAGATPLTVVWGGGTAQLYADVAAVVVVAVLGVRLLRHGVDTAGTSPPAGEDRMDGPFLGRRPDDGEASVVVGVALLAMGASAYWYGAGAGRGAAIEVALAVLVAGSPVVLALSGPVAAVGAWRAARWRGVVAESSAVVGVTRRVDAVLLGPAALGATPQDVGDAVAGLRRLGLDPVFLTSDHDDVAGTRARGLGIDAVVADLPEEEQAAAVRRLQDSGCTVAVVGASDSPTAAADVGISFTAAGVSSVTLIDPGLPAAVEVLRLGRRAAVVSRINARLAIGGTSLTACAAAGGLVRPSLAVGLAVLLAVVLTSRSLAGFHDTAGVLAPDERVT